MAAYTGFCIGLGYANMRGGEDVIGLLVREGDDGTYEVVARHISADAYFSKLDIAGHFDRDFADVGNAYEWAGQVTNDEALSRWPLPVSPKEDA